MESFAAVVRTVLSQIRTDPRTRRFVPHAATEPETARPASASLSPPAVPPAVALEDPYEVEPAIWELLATEDVCPRTPEPSPDPPERRSRSRRRTRSRRRARLLSDPEPTPRGLLSV